MAPTPAPPPMAALGEGGAPIWLTTAAWVANPVSGRGYSGSVAADAAVSVLEGGGKAAGISDAKRRGESAVVPPLVGTVTRHPERDAPAAAKTRQRTDTTARTRDIKTPIGFCLGNRCFDDVASVTAQPHATYGRRTFRILNTKKAQTETRPGWCGETG